MRHKFGYRKLNRTSEHRKALFKNMLNSLIKYEQITTTLPKAKELKPQIDKAITLGKKNNLQSKKNLFAELQSKSSVCHVSLMVFVINGYIINIGSFVQQGKFSESKGFRNEFRGCSGKMNPIDMLFSQSKVF